MQERAHPVAGVDYPRTLHEFEAWFSTEQGCADYVRRLRWPNGFQCPCCGQQQAWNTARQVRHCTGCGHPTSVTAGTIFEGTRKPLRLWFQAMWYITNQKCGVSALGLKRVLGLGRYQTAWAWLHKLRRAMVRPSRDLLSGRVEVDESSVGGEEEGGHGRQTETKAMVAIAIEVHSPKGFGRVRLRQVPDVSGPSLIGFIRDVVAPGATVITDGWQGYRGLSTPGYIHEQKSPLRPPGPRTRCPPRSAPCCLSAQAWAAGNPPGRSTATTTRLLLGRVHIPVQQARLEIQRASLPSTHATGGPGRSGTVSRNLGDFTQQCDHRA